jgi:hypothetical protein
MSSKKIVLRPTEEVPPIIPDQQAFENVERDYPNKPDAEKLLLAQADMLLRAHGYVRQGDGTYEKPKRPCRKSS